MQMSEQSQAVLLLTAWLGKPGKGEVKPLAPREWGRFALWLKEQGRSPVDLLNTCDVPALLQGWRDRDIDAPRIQQLLERGAVMGIALEKVGARRPVDYHAIRSGLSLAAQATAQD